jgi:hypothetical protein
MKLVYFSKVFYHIYHFKTLNLLALVSNLRHKFSRHPRINDDFRELIRLELGWSPMSYRSFKFSLKSVTLFKSLIGGHKGADIHRLIAWLSHKPTFSPIRGEVA